MPKWGAQAGIRAFGLGLDFPERCPWPHPAVEFQGRNEGRERPQLHALPGGIKSPLTGAAPGAGGCRWGQDLGWHSSGRSGMLPAFLGRHSRTGESCQEGGAPTPGLCQLPPRCHPQPGRDPRDSEVPVNSRVLSLSQAARQQWDPSSRHPSRARTSRIWCQRVRGSHSTP